jgi:hypothetical protein
MLYSILGTAMEGRWLRSTKINGLSGCRYGMEGFWLPALKWKGSGCQEWTGMVLAVRNGLEGFWLHWNERVLAALEWKGSGCIGMEGFLLPALKWKDSGCIGMEVF